MTSTLSTTPLPWLALSNSHLVDLAGIDGLAFAHYLLGERVRRIAPFQSWETALEGHSCSVLRLCEGNFRMRLQGPGISQVLLTPPSGFKVWVKPLDWLSAIALPDAIAHDLLPALVIPKPPHRLVGLQPHCAIPGRLDGLSVLIWRHPLQGQLAIELHTAREHVETVKAKIQFAEPLRR